MSYISPRPTVQSADPASTKVKLASEQYQSQDLCKSLADNLQLMPRSNHQGCPEVQKVLEVGRLATANLAFQALPRVDQYSSEMLPALQDEAVISLLTVTQELIELKQKEEGLQRNKEGFQQLFNNGSIAMGIASSNGRFLMANQQLCKMMGYSRPELLDLTFWDISHPADHDKEFGLLEKALQQTENILTVEKRYIRKDKTVIWVKITVSLVTNQAGEVQYQIGTVEKMSDRNASNLD